jgi:hypothetical protein
MKLCSNCNTLKSYSDFYKSRQTKDGYYCHCKVCIRLYKNQYTIRCPEKRKQWRKTSNSSHRLQRNLYQLNKKKYDINFKIRKLVSDRILKALKNNYKFSCSIELLGCTIPELKQQLEKQFKIGMSWSNHGNWHIDHIKPCASFDLTKESEQRKCFHYSNLQPLWAKENSIKGKKVWEK